MKTGNISSLATLRYCLFDRALHPELFDIHLDHAIEQTRYEARIWITGCSHVIGFHAGEHSMSEVIANADAMLPERGQLLNMPFQGERAHEQKKAGGLSYMMNFQVESMTPPVYIKTHHELARLGAKHGLFVPFPMWMVNSLTPFTYINYDARPGELHVFAFHALPADLTIVKIQSIFSIE